MRAILQLREYATQRINSNLVQPSGACEARWMCRFVMDCPTTYSTMGLVKPGQALTLMAVCPFRPAHHSLSDAGLVGGLKTPQPGEINQTRLGCVRLSKPQECRPIARTIAES